MAARLGQERTEAGRTQLGPGDISVCAAHTWPEVPDPLGCKM